MTLAEVVQDLGICQRRVHQLTAQGILRVAKRYGNSPAFARADVERARLRNKRDGWPKGKKRKA